MTRVHWQAISEALPEITEEISGTTRVAVLNFSIE